MPSLLTYDGGSGYFDKLGPLCAGAAEEVACITELKTRRDTIIAEFPGTQSAWIEATINNLQARIDAGIQRMMDYRDDATRLTIEFVNATIPLPTPTLDNALRALITDMLNGSECIKGNTVQAANATVIAGNTGNAMPFGSATANSASLLQAYFEYLPAETLTIECVDPSDRAASAIQMYRVTGDIERDGMDPDWPGGSGIDVIIPGIDAGNEKQTAFWRNLLNKGSFESFTGSTPDGWAVQTGTPATHFDAAGAGYKGVNALKWISGATAELRQTVNSAVSTGTTGQMLPKSQYFLAAAVKTGTAGGASKAVLIGTSSANWYSMTPSGTTYELIGRFARTLAVEPTYVKISVTAIDRDIHFDEFRIALVPALTLGGPYIAVAQGATASAVGDKWTIAITNNWAGVFSQWMERFFGLRRRGLVIPADITSPTISDALVA